MDAINFIQSINLDIEKYIKSQDHNFLTSCRNIKSEFIYEQEKTKKPDSEILKKMYNKRKETSEIYRTVNQSLYEDEVREMSIIQPFLPPELNKDDILKYLNTLDITKEKKNFKLFQNNCEQHFGQKVDSKIILEYLNS